MADSSPATTAPAPAPATSSSSSSAAASKRQSSVGVGGGGGAAAAATAATSPSSSSTLSSSSAAAAANTNRLSMNVASAATTPARFGSPTNSSSSSSYANHSGTQGPGEFDALGRAIGARIKVTTSGPSPQTIEGTLFTACPITNLVAINTTLALSAATTTPDQSPAKVQSSKFHVIPVARIQTFSLVSLPPTAGGFEAAQPSITRLDVKALKAREDDAIQKIKARDATRGKGVTKEGQDIFDALSRTLPTRWHETSIIVNDTVMIRAPYRVEDCQADKQNQNALIRVKKVLESEKKKIADRNAIAASTSQASNSSSGATVATAAAATPPPTTAPRKGG